MTAAIKLSAVDRLRVFWEERKPLVKRRLPAYVITGVAIYTFTRFYAVALINSESIPGLFVWIKLEQPSISSLHRGDMIFVKYSGQRLENHYPGDNWVKFVRGLPGDKVEVKERAVYVNGELIGKAKTHTSHGSPLSPTTAGIVPPGYVFIAGTHTGSFDSRYSVVGLQPVSAIHGRATLLF